jgi:hypothetical protein
MRAATYGFALLHLVSFFLTLSCVVFAAVVPALFFAFSRRTIRSTFSGVGCLFHYPPPFNNRTRTFIFNYIYIYTYALALF